MRLFVLTTFVLGLIVIGQPSRGCAQSSNGKSASVSATAVALVVYPISLTKSKDLDFGEVVPGSSPGTVTVSPTGVVTVGGTDGPFARPNNGATNAEFTVSGQSGYAYDLTIDNVQDLSNGTPSQNLHLHLFTISSNMTAISGSDASPWRSLGNHLPSVLLPVGGNESTTFQIGARIDVAGNAPVATYIGSFDVTVAYQ